MGEGNGTTRASERNGRRGSASSDRQIARAVKERLRVTFQIANYPAVSGWVCGVDDYHWVVATEQGTTLLIHKSCPLVTITTTSLDDANLKRGALESITQATEPFRNRVLADHYGQKTPETRSESA